MRNDSGCFDDDCSSSTSSGGGNVGPDFLSAHWDEVVGQWAGKNHSIPLGDHDLFDAQVIERAVSAAYEEYSKPQEEGLATVYDRFLNDCGEPKTLSDVGAYLHQIKLAEPRFTGRAAP